MNVFMQSAAGDDDNRNLPENSYKGTVFKTQLEEVVIDNAMDGRRLFTVL